MIHFPEKSPSLKLWTAVLIIAFLVGMLSGCSTKDSIDRADHAVEQAQLVLNEANAAQKKIDAALEVARVANDRLRTAETKALMAEVEQGAAIVREGVARAGESLAMAQNAAKTARETYEAGGSTIDVLIAIGATFIPALGALKVLRNKYMPSVTAIKQTVAGLDEARKSMGDTLWDAHVAPALESSQDEAIRTLIRQLQTANDLKRPA